MSLTTWLGNPPSDLAAEVTRLNRRESALEGRALSTTICQPRILGRACKTSLVLLFAALTFAARSAEDYDLLLENLIPYLGAPRADERAAGQQELEDLIARACKPGAGSARARFAKTLASRITDASVPQAARLGMVRPLELIGHGESVSALTTLLDGSDSQLRENARRALERNPSSSASSALESALEKATETTWIIGLMGSLGERRESGAASAIIPHLDKPATAAAAAFALAKIGNGAALDALFAAMSRQVAAAGDGLVMVATARLARGDKSGARSIFERLYETNRPTVVRIAALNGLAQTDPAGTRKLVLHALADPDPKLQRAAVVAAPAAFGPELTSTLTPLLSGLAPSAKIIVLGILDASAEKSIIEATVDKDPTVRLAAVTALGRIGTIAAVPALLRSATNVFYAERMAADASLVRIPGTEASALIARTAGEGPVPLRAAAIRAIVGRSQTAALSDLVQYASEKPPQINRPALDGLRQMGGQTELDDLARIAATSGDPEALVALRAVVSRAKDRALTAQTLLKYCRNADPKAQVTMLNALGVVGGPDALEEVSRLTASENAGVKDAAIRALSGWTDFTASTRLLEIARDESTATNHHGLAIKAVARLIQEAGPKTPTAVRLDMALSALQAARRDDDKKAALSALGSVTDWKAVEAAVPYLDNKALQLEASLAGIAVVERLFDTDKAKAKDLAQVIKTANASPEVVRRVNAVLLR